jgi:hypothetical protein
MEMTPDYSLGQKQDVAAGQEDGFVRCRGLGNVQARDAPMGIVKVRNREIQNLQSLQLRARQRGQIMFEVM